MKKKSKDKNDKNELEEACQLFHVLTTKVVQGLLLQALLCQFLPEWVGMSSIRESWSLGSD